MSKNVNRRDAIKTTAGAAAMFLAGATARAASAQDAEPAGKLKFGVTRGYGRKYSMDEFCAGIKKIGLVDVGLAGPEEWPILAKHGLYCSVNKWIGVDNKFDKTEYLSLQKNIQDKL